MSSSMVNYLTRVKVKRTVMTSGKMTPVKLMYFATV